MTTPKISLGEVNIVGPYKGIGGNVDGIISAQITPQFSVWRLQALSLIK
jgi:hypothetical protein